MSESWILESKLRTPLAPPGWLRRALPELDAPVALMAISGGPGMGKSLALLELVTRRGGLALWLGLDEDDADPATFFHYLVAGMRRHVPDFGAQTLDLLRGGKLEPRPLWRSFFADVAAFGLPGLTLALDDAQHLRAEPAILQGLVALADKLPPGVVVGLATRGNLPLGGALARGLARRVDEGALRFTPTEQAAYFAGRSGWEARVAELDGWPLGLALVAAEGSAPTGGADALEAYVADELYHTQPAVRRQLMLGAALLGDLCAETLARVLDEPDAALHLAALEEDGLVRRLEGDLYAFPAYLATYLRAEARRALPALQRAEFHRRAATALPPELALPHLVAAGDWPGAIAAALQAFPAMRHDGRQATLDRLRLSFPPEVRAAEPALALWEGHALSRAGQVAEATAAYERARGLAAAREDGALELGAAVRLATLAARAGDGARFNRLVMQVLARADEVRPEDLADLQLTRAMVADQRGDAALMRECNEAALAVAVDDNPEIAASHAIARLNLFTAAWNAGELDEALKHADAARGGEPTPFTVYASFLSARVLLERGELEAAQAAIAGVPAYWPELLDWHMVAGAYTVLGLLHTRRGQWTEAEAELRRSLARWGDYVLGRKVAQAALAELALARKQLARVEAIVAEAAVPEDPALWNVYDLALVLPRTRARQQAGQDVTDEAGTLAAMAQNLGAKLLATQARALLADEPAAPPPAAEGGLSLRVFGGFEVRVDGQPIETWTRRKARAILAALALRRGPVPALELASLLAEGEAGAGPAVLKVTMGALRRNLEPNLDQANASKYVKTTTDGYALVREHLASCDLDDFDSAMAQAGPLRQRDPAGAAEAYARALGVYRGDLFGGANLGAGFEPEQAAYRRQALDAALWLAEQQPEARQAWLERAVEIAPCEEDTYVELMCHHRGQGRLDRVRQTYWDCRKALKRHLGLAPSEEFEATCKRLEAG